MKNLLNVIATWLVKVTTPKTVQIDIKEVVRVKSKAVHPQKDHSESYYTDMNWLELQRYHKEIVDTWLADIQAEIFAKGYKAIPETLQQYRTEMIQHYVTMQKIALGDYAPEYDNLDALTREKLIELASELNQYSFEKRMIQSGKADITAKQIAFLNKNGITDMPSNKFDATRLINSILVGQGIDTSKAYDPNPSEAQLKRVATLGKLLNKDCKMLDVSTKRSCSALIGSLQAELDSKPELSPKATEKQIEAVKRYLALLGKRMTAKRLAEYTAMNSSQISVVITDLKKQHDLLHPEASEGQVSYIISLCDSLNIPCEPLAVKQLTKVQATAKIEELRRKWLYVLTRKTTPGMTQDDIALMSSDSVNALITHIKEESKTREYTADDFTKDRLPE